MTWRWFPVVAVLFASPALAQVDNDAWFGSDKAAHFAVSTGIAAFGTLSANLVSDSVAVKLSLGCALSLAAGAGKELLDLAGFGTPSWKDFAWDVIGTFTGAVVALLIDQLLIAPMSRLPAW